MVSRRGKLHVLGFDVRVDPGLPDPAWSAERRALYLVRTDVRRPLSLDRTVWPALVLPDAPSRWRELWDEFEVLAEARALVPALLRGALIALGVVLSDSEPAPPDLLGLTSLVAPTAPEPDWRLLGYDVTDGCTSGLSNCGYRRDEIDSIRSRWAPLINPRGLFDDAGAAARFRAETELRVHEHAPFQINALWSIPDPSPLS